MLQTQNSLIMISKPFYSSLVKRLFEMGYAKKQLFTLLEGFTYRFTLSYSATIHWT